MKGIFSTSEKVSLPPDFVDFISKNYERIEDVQKKLKQFKIGEQNNYCGDEEGENRRGRFNDGYTSFDSYFSDQDMVDIISAKIVPKVKLVDSFDMDGIHVQSEDLDDWLREDPDFDADLEEFQSLVNRFPLAYLSGPEGAPVLDKNLDNDNRNKSKAASLSRLPTFLIIKGIQMVGSQRVDTRYKTKDILTKYYSHFPISKSRQIKKSTHKTHHYPHNCHNRSKKNKNRKNCRDRETEMNLMTSKATTENDSQRSPYSSNAAQTQNQQNNSSNQNRRQGLDDNFKANYTDRMKERVKKGKGHQVTLQSATINELTTELYRRYYSSNDLQLTLPPLHSSVLTLLGQRPPTKASPRAFGSSGQTGLDGMPQSSSRPRKLRRPGRKSKKDGKQNEETLNANSVRDEGNRTEGLSKLTKSPSRDGAGGGRKGLVDDPHDTQMSAMSHRDTDDELDLRKADEADAVGNIVENMNDLNAKRFEAYMEQSARSLHEILDEQLVGTEWNPKEMKLIDDKIQNLKDDFKKYETKFKAGHIRMKEDMWLSLPRTWSRASATFGIPTDIRALSKLSPIEYIEKYIFISEPRKHLYSLVFHRYRTMENPTGKTITYNVVQRALAEVLGRSLDTADASRLQNEILSIPSVSMDVTEHLFRSICAVSERIFGKYSLEDCNECYACLKYKGKDKSRCHKNQKDQIERVDFEYVASKIKDGKVNPKLAELLQMVFDRG